MAPHTTNAQSRFKQNIGVVIEMGIVLNVLNQGVTGKNRLSTLMPQSSHADTHAD